MKEDQTGEIQRPLLSEAKLAAADKPADPQLPPAPFFSLFRYTSTSQRMMLAIGTLASIVAGAVFPFFLLFFADITTIFQDTHRGEAAAKGWELCWKFLIIGGITWFANFLGSYCWNMVGSSQSVKVKKLYYKALLQQEVGWFDANDPNSLVTKVATSITALETATSEKMSLLITTLITSVAAIFLAFFKCWELSVMLLATLPALIIGGVLFMKALMLNAQREKISFESAASRTEQALGQIKTVKGLNGEKHELDAFQGALEVGKAKSVRNNLLSSCGHGLLILIFISIYSFGFWYGKKLIIDNWDTQKYDVGVILSTFFCFLVGGSSVGQISPFMKNIADGKIAMAEFLHLITREKAIVQPEDGKKLKIIQSITLQNVSFSYKKDQPVLKNVDLLFKHGKVSAIVGESGCGKSTIVQLLLRYYDAERGNILVNTSNIKDLNMNNFRRKVGFVGQEPVLFAMSIADNLKLAQPDLTREEMIAVLKQANAWEFVEKMEKGLDTYVGSGGTQLSGGQKQRIAIARALCKKPQLLILDEATSALDRKNEREIQQTFKNLQSNRITTIVIAHRLSTVRDADCIYVMNKGEVAQQGTHNQLLEQGGLYSQLVKTQVAAEERGEEETKEEAKIVVEKDNQPEQLAKAKVNEVDEGPSKQKQDKVFKKLLAYEKSNISLLLIGVLGALLSGLVWPFFNYVFSGILSLMVNPIANDDELNQYCLYILLVAITAGTSTLVYTFAFGLASERLLFKVRLDLYNKLLRLPASYFDQKQNTAGAISTRLASDAFQIRNMVSGVMGVMCLNTATITTSLIFGLYYSWKVTLIALALSPLIAVVGSLNMKVIVKFTTKSQQAEKFLGSLMNDSVTNIRTVKSLGRPRAFLDEFGNKLDELSSVNGEKHFKSAILSGMGKGMIMFVEGIIFFIAAVLFQDGQVESGRAVFTAVFSIIFAAMGVGQNSAFMPDMGKAKAAGAAIFDIIESKGEDELSVEGGGLNPADFKGTIEFQNVSFRYPQREKMVLENLSFKVEKQKIALVGHSGSGKSTIVQLIMRFYEPTEGRILVDGRDIREYDLYSLRQQFGLVSQEPALFVGTVAENIRYNTNCTQEEIESAATTAQASKFISQWEEGYKKEVGQKGAQVSGGQKQRIALSRCLVKRTPGYLFDEFTSALDADTERLVFDNLRPILQGKTSLSIAHRMSTVKDCDHILMFKDGKVIEEGTYNDLMDRKQHFYALAQQK